VVKRKVFSKRLLGFLPTTSCRLLLLLLLTAHCSLLTVPAASWTKQRTSSLAWLHAVYFLDQDRGWAVGSRGTLLATENGGKSWQARPQPTQDTIRDIYFSDESDGWLLCERNIYDLKSNDEPRAYLMRTTDGGEHWQRTNLHGANVDARLMRALFSSGGRGWAFGEGGAIFMTRDSGANWTKLQTPTHYLLLGGSFVDENTGWLVGADATILQTSDGGETWRQGRMAPANVRFNATSFVNVRQGWAVGSDGAIYRTINGGRSWQSQNSGVVADLLDVRFFDSVEGWVVGAEGTLLHTNDGGLHWISGPSVTPHPLERLFFTDRTHGWAVGFGGTILSFSPANERKVTPRLKP
jgi:photosystem II stability/assembly factor-like uncharacterized protein